MPLQDMSPHQTGSVDCWFLNERCSPLMQSFSRALLKLFGWSLEYDDPGTRRYVLIVAPHTSNWDFLIGLLAAWGLGLNANWMGKHTIFLGPLSPLFRAMGGIPVYRNDASDMVQQMANRFAETDHLVLGMAPEGTRSYQAYWKSGFWRIARAAEVPIAMAVIDYRRKEVTLGGAFMPTEDIEGDFAHIRDFYRNKRGLHPGNEGPIRSREGTG